GCASRWRGSRGTDRRRPAATPGGRPTHVGRPIKPGTGESKGSVAPACARRGRDKGGPRTCPPRRRRSRAATDPAGPGPIRSRALEAQPFLAYAAGAVITFLDATQIPAGRVAAERQPIVQAGNRLVP